jgi:hypothetical protein
MVLIASGVDIPWVLEVLESRLSFRFFFSFFVLSFYTYYIFKKRANRIDHLIFANCLAITALFDGGGNALDLYSNKYQGIYYDKYMHLFLPFIVALGYSTFLAFSQNIDREMSVRAFLAVLVVFQMTVLFEAYEYLSDKYFGTDMVAGLDDTINDILLDYVGIMSAFLVVWIFVVKKRLLDNYKQYTNSLKNSAYITEYDLKDISL